MHKAEETKPKQPQPKGSGNSYLRFSTLGIQMAAIIAVGVYLGMKLDTWLNTKPYLSALCSLLFVCLAMYLAIREVSKKD